MSEEILQAAGDLAHWRRRAEQSEAMLRTVIAELEQAKAESVQLMAGMRRASDELDRAEADAAALRHALSGTTRVLADRSDNKSRAWVWAHHIIDANQQVLIAAHPGVALLAELDAARRAVDLARTAVRRGVFPRELREAIEDYDRLVKR